MTQTTAARTTSRRVVSDMPSQPVGQAGRPGRFRATGREPMRGLLEQLDAVPASNADRGMALGLWVRLWICEAFVGGYVAHSAAGLAELVGVTPATVRRLLRLLYAAGMLTREGRGWRIPDAAALEGISRAAGTPGFERTPIAPFRIRLEHLADHAPGRTRRGPFVLAAAGTYWRAVFVMAPFRGVAEDGTVLPRPVSGAGRRPLSLTALAGPLHADRGSLTHQLAGLAAVGLLDSCGRGYSIGSLSDLASAQALTPPVPGAPAGTNSPRSAAAGGSNFPRSERVSRDLASCRDLSVEDVAGAATSATRLGSPPDGAGRWRDPDVDADADHEASRTNGSRQSSHQGEDRGDEHPQLAATVASVIRADGAYSALGHPHHPGRAVLDRGLREGLLPGELVDHIVNAGYTVGSRHPAAVLAKGMPRFLDRVAETRAQRRPFATGRPASTPPAATRWTATPTGGSQRDPGLGSLMGLLFAPTPKPLALVLGQDREECPHGFTRCDRCPDCRAGQPDELSGDVCTRCRPQDATGTAHGTPPTHRTPPAPPAPRQPLQQVAAVSA